MRVDLDELQDAIDNGNESILDEYGGAIIAELRASRACVSELEDLDGCALYGGAMIDCATLRAYYAATKGDG